MTRLKDELRGNPAGMPASRPVGVTVVMTVKNDPLGSAQTLSSLAAQTRRPQEIIVVDGGSTDETLRVIRRYSTSLPQLRLIEAPGANIARGRNIGTTLAANEIIATTDSGCRADSDWLANLIRPFEQDSRTEFVAGMYRVACHTLLEEVVACSTMRGHLEPVRPETFNPSARSMAYTKSLWVRAGRWPEWLCYSEDTLWDHKIRRLEANWVFAGDAIVSWRPRTTIRQLARQFYNYGTGRGHTQIEAADFAYNLRNAAIVATAAALCLLTPWMLPVVLALCAYFYVWTFAGTARRAVRKTERFSAFPLCILVMWVVLVANTAGYVVGSWQRRRHHGRYRIRTEAYLAVS